MKFSEQWLRSWVNPQVSREELVARLSMVGLEVDAVAPVAGSFSGVVVGEVLETVQHPDADKLRVCQVSNGSETFQVVCGAPNVRPGLKIPFAMIGAQLPGDFKIKKAKLRGIESNGMLCSETELQVGSDDGGLMELAGDAPAGTVCLLHKNPYKAYALAAQAFYPAPAAQAFVSPAAVVDASAVIGADCHIGHGAVIGKGVKIGARSRIGALCVIEDGVEIGADCDIGARVYLTHAVIGNKVRIYPGAVIGRAGFGFAIDMPNGFVSVPQLGRVVVGDDVEIGANTTIDRGAGPDTVIGQGTRIDNLVQIGHNVQIGRFCVIVSQTGISGSTQLGDGVMTGGQSGFAGHLKIGAGAKIAAQSGIMRDIPQGGEVMGSPAVPIRQFMRQTAIWSRISLKKGNDET